MEIIIKILISSWIYLAFIMSIFWGIRSTVLFASKENIWWKSYQFIFNFVGSYGGWFCFYCLLIRTQNNMPQFHNFTTGDIILFVVSLLGLTGHLPQVTHGFIQGFVEIAKRSTEKLTK